MILILYVPSHNVDMLSILSINILFDLATMRLTAIDLMRDDIYGPHNLIV